MNRIFKVIWSKTKHCYVVVSEYAKANTKAAHTGVRVTAAALAAAAVLLAPVDYSTVWAQTATIEVASTDGNTKTDVYTKDGADSKFATWDEVKNKADKTDVQQETAAREAADNEIKEDVAKKANASDVYTKSETDSKVKEAETYTYRKVAAEEKARAEKDNELNERITNEANDIHKTTNELNDRITNVKESLQKEAADTYVSKDDAAVQDGAQVKASNKVGQNLQNLDTALAKETAARVTSEKTQNEAIATVNTNLVTAVAAINQNVSDGFTALNQADANEAAAREQADTELSNRVTTVESKTTDLSYDKKTKTTTVNDKLAADSAQITKSIAVGNNANIGGAVNAGNLNSRGNLNVDGNALVKGTLTSQSTINGKEIVSQTNITAKNKVVGMQGVVDNTLTSGTYVTAGNTVGQNINALDEQVKTNAETANQLQHSLAAEATAREDGDNAIRQAMTDQKTSTALHVSKDGNLIVGTNENQTVKDVKIRGQLTSGSISTGNITSTGDVSVAGKVEAEAVYDDTTKTENYVVQTNSVGSNLSALDTQVKANADAVAAKANASDVYTKTETDNKVNEAKTYTYRKVASEETARKAADNELNERITNEANAIHETTNKLQEGLNTEVKAREDGDKALSEQITNEANAIHETTNKLQGDLTTEAQTREAKDNELNERITNEANAIHDEIKASDTALDNRITEVKNYLQQDAAATYVSKDDASVQDGAVVKANNKVGQNVQALDTALAKETAARIGADKAQDKVIAQVNQNMADGFNTINTNMANGFNALNAADAAEKKARVEADTKLTEAVNNGLSLNDENVLQKNTTTIDENGTITTSKTDASEMILNKGKDNQVTLNEKGIKVGTNSSVMDANGVYTGGDDFDAAKAAMSSDGRIKGANGKFTVDASGNTTVTSLDAGTGTIQTKGDLYAKDATFSGDITAKDATLSGDLSAKDGTFSGDLSAKDGTFSGDVSAKDVTATGTLKGAEVTDGTATMKNGSLMGAKDITASGKITSGSVETGTLKTTGDAEVGGDLTVKGKLNVDEIDMTKNGIVGDNNVTASTKVTAGEITGYKKATSTKDGSEKESAFDYDENGTSTWATTTDADKNWKKSTMSVEGSGVTSKAIDSEKNSNLSTQTATQSQSTLTDADKNTNTATQSATESSSILANKEGLSSTFKQNVSEILNQINKSDTEYAKVDQKVDNITSEVKNGDNSTSTTQTATDIVNTAEHGTISNNAKNLTNTASENITNTSTNGNISNIAANGTITNEAKNISNKAAEALTNDAKTITNTASESVTMQIGDGSVVKSVMNENGIANTAADKAITNDAADITNTGTNSVTNQVGTNKVLVNNDKVETAYGDDTYTTWDASGIVNSTTGNMSTTVGGSQTTNVTGDSSLTAENINNTAKNKITNKALDVETEAASSIVNKVSNDYGTNTSTQTSSQTQEEMSQEDGKTASYLRGAGEEKSQLTNGDTKTTIDTIAGQTNTNITDGTNTSNNLQKAAQIASSVTDGTNTTVVNQDAKSLASSITDGTKANNTNNTVDQSVQVIKASDTKFSASTKTAGAFNDTLVSGDSIVNILKDADNGFVQSNVSKGDNSTSVKQTSTDITNTAKNGTIANDAKNIVNKAAENMTNTVGKDLTTTVGGEMKTTVTGKVTEDYKSDLSTKVGGSENHAVTGNQVNTIGGDQSTSVTGDSSLSAKNISNTATEKLSNSAAEIENTATTSIKDIVGKTTITTNDSGTTFENTDHNTAVKEGSASNTVISGNTLTTGQATMDYADVLKDLGVHGNAAVDGNTTLGKEGADTTLTVNSKSTFKDTVKMEKTLEVDGTSTFNDKVTVTKGGLDVTGGTKTDTLYVTSTSTFDGPATFKDIVTMEKDLTVGGNAAVTGSVTASSYKVGDTTYIDANGINANNQKVTNVAAGDLSAASTDAVNGSQLYSTNQRVSTVENRVDGVENRVTNVENRVDKMDSRIDKVGANAAAMANLHPLEFDEDSKWNVAAAVGNYKGETAAAVGAFYRPNEDVMFNLSTTFGNDENMVGGGVSLRLGKGGNHEKDKKLKAALAENNDLRSKVDNLTARMDALLSVLNPSMSKDFPDVPANHWAYEAVSRLAGNDIVQGYADGKFHGERTMTRYEMAEIIYNALSKGAKAEKKLVEEFKPELQAMAAQKQAK